MKTADEIIREAPTIESYGMPLAFCCQTCPWWAHDPKYTKEGLGNRRTCGACGGPLNPLPLTVLVQSTKESKTIEGFEDFIQANAANSGVREEDNTHADD